jgi:hypothetical protein
MDNYTYNLSFTDVSHLLDLLSKQDDEHSARMKIQLSIQLSRWKVWDQKLNEIQNEPEISFTGI